MYLYIFLHVIFDSADEQDCGGEHPLPQPEEGPAQGRLHVQRCS